ncbi:MAG: hypothetical protein CMJ75_09265 [Planctomycetaceae bacterium]|nr:hypothetical protein [Planctomycetaceae bacterium]
MRTKHKQLFALGVLAIGLIAVWLEPGGRLRGRLQGEAFFQGYPVHYWQRQLQSSDPVVVETTRAELAAGRRSATEVLRALLIARSTGNWDTSSSRCTAAEILTAIGEEAAAAGDDVVSTLTDSDTYLRRIAAGAVPAVGVPASRGVPALLELLKRERSVEVLRALSEYGGQAQPALTELGKVLRDRSIDTEVRWNAARTIGKVREKAVSEVALLVEHLQDEEATVREHSAEALGDIGPGAATSVPALVAVLTDKATRVRRDAVRSLGQIGPAAQAAVPDILKLLKDPEPIVQQAARTALETLAPDQLPKAKSDHSDVP